MDRSAGQSKLATTASRRLILAASGPLVLVFLWIIRRFYQPLGHDQISYLLEAQRFLSGNQIYGPYISETNPPAIIWFSAIPVFLARHLHLPVIFTFRALGDILVCASAVWCLSILQRSRRWTTPAATALAGIGILVVEIDISAFDFGQREHLLVILLLPYLLAVASDATSRLLFAERCALGIAAGCAVWFKPQDVLVLIALELLYAIFHRTMRRALCAEFIAFVLTASFILAMVLLLAPLYLAQVLPLLMDLYWAIGMYSFFALLLLAKPYVALMLVGLFLCILRRARSHDWSTPVALLICSAAGFFAYGIQHTDWPYHKYPHRALLELTLLCLIIDWLDPKFAAILKNGVLPRWAGLLGATTALILFCLVLIDPAITRLGYKPPKHTQFDLFLDQVRDQGTPGTTVTVLSTDVVPLASVYVHHLEWGSRFAHLWMMPGIMQNERGRTSPSTPFKKLSPERVSSLAALQRSETTEDLKYWNPAWVFIQRCTKVKPCLGMENKDIDLLSWFQQSPDFMQVWSRYDRQPSIDQFDVYKLAR